MKASSRSWSWPAGAATLLLAVAALADDATPAADVRVFFDHVRHAPHAGDCASCHRAAPAGRSPGAEVSASDFEWPSEADCTRCHPFERLSAAERAGGADPEACGVCHPRAATGRVGLPVVAPRHPAVDFDHARHEAVSGAGCAACHDAAQVESGAPPGMPRCLGCHEEALSSGCARCHQQEARGRLRTERPGRPPLVPPAWMGEIAHGPDFARTHAGAARARGALCASCHEDVFCQGCHLGEALERRLHPAGWISAHGAAGRVGDLDCETCHRGQETCLGCHRRAGAAADSPAIGSSVPRGSSYHAATWSSRPDEHARAARRDLVSCVSCHAARDCLACHATRASPHGPGFGGRCGGLREVSPDTCRVCHAGVPACP